MKVRYQFKSGIWLEWETDNLKTLFETMADWSELLDIDVCGKCGKKNLQFTVRNVQDNNFYELRCKDCRARLSFGLKKDGKTVFARRKDNGGNWLPDNGWMKWDSKLQKEV